MSKPGYTKQSFWIRLVFMVLYWIIFNVALSVFGFLLLLMTIIRFGSQHKPESILTFQFNLTEFITETMAFLTFKTEEKPYPFKAWPQVKQDD